MKKESLIQFNKDAEKAIDNFCEEMTKVYEDFIKANNQPTEAVTEKMTAFKQELLGQIIISAVDIEALSE